MFALNFPLLHSYYLHRMIPLCLEFRRFGLAKFGQNVPTASWHALETNPWAR